MATETLTVEAAPEAQTVRQPAEVPAAAEADAAIAAPAATGAPAIAAIRDLPRLSARLFGTPLMVAPKKLAIIMQAVGPRFGAMEDDEGGASLDELDEKAAEERRASVRRILGLADDELDDGSDEAPFVLTSDGIAIIPVEGTLVYKSGWLGALSGLMSYSDIANSLEEAVENPAVKGILLVVDSYGGEVNGCFDLADAIFAARAQKPVFAAAADEAYSAAYALISAADRVYASRTSGLGSIGVVALHVDQSEADKARGLKYTYVFAGDRKIDGNAHQPLSGEARDTIQEQCNRMQQLFAASVAKYRSGLTVDAILAMQAGCFYGSEAIDAKLADGLGTPADALADLRAEVGRRAAASGGLVIAARSSAAATPPATAEVITLEEVRGKAASEATARALAIAELCKLAGKADLAADFIANGLTEDAVRQQLQSLKAQASESHAIASHHNANAGLDSQEGVSRLWDGVIQKYGFAKKK